MVGSTDRTSRHASGRLLGQPRLTDDLDVVGRLEQLPQAAADDLVVVQEEDANGHSWSTPVPLEGGQTQVSTDHSDAVDRAVSSADTSWRRGSVSLIVRTPITVAAKDAAASPSRSGPCPVMVTTPWLTVACQPGSRSASSRFTSSWMSSSSRDMARMMSLRLTTPTSSSPRITGRHFHAVRRKRAATSATSACSEVVCGVLVINSATVLGVDWATT